MAFDVQCHPTGGGASVPPCVSVDGVDYAPVMVELTIAEIDYQTGGQLFAFALTMVVGCWLTGLAVGAIVRVVRSA